MIGSNQTTPARGGERDRTGSWGSLAADACETLSRGTPRRTTEPSRSSAQRRYGLRHRAGQRRGTGVADVCDVPPATGDPRIPPARPKPPPKHNPPPPTPHLTPNLPRPPAAPRPPHPTGTTVGLGRQPSRTNPPPGPPAPSARSPQVKPEGFCFFMAGARVESHPLTPECAGRWAQDQAQPSPVGRARGTFASSLKAPVAEWKKEVCVAHQQRNRKADG